MTSLENIFCSGECSLITSLAQTATDGLLTYPSLFNVRRIIHSVNSFPALDLKLKGHLMITEKYTFTMYTLQASVTLDRFNIRMLPNVH